MKASSPALALDVFDFWFGTAFDGPQQAIARSKAWFSYDPEFDAEIERRFGTLPQRALEGGLDDWSRTPTSALARIIVLDQFPRNLYRESARAFAFDALAARAASAAVDAGFHLALDPRAAVFMLLPFEHAESIALQERSVELFGALRARAPAGCEALFDGYLDYAGRHRDVISRFGRFPHRNALLERESTAAEVEYLTQGGERFGPKKS